MNTKPHLETIEQRRAHKHAAAVKWAAAFFEIPETEVVAYNSGCCYNKVWVRTEESAQKCAAKVKGETVNGGLLDGMPLGSISSYDGKFEVMC